MTTKEFFQSSYYSNLIKILAVLLVALIIFSAGMQVGYRRASFSMGWDNNYITNMSNGGQFLEPFNDGDRDNINPHGAIGNIISINLPSMIVRGPHQAEQVIIVGTSTIVRNLRSPAEIKDLRVGDNVIVIGSPLENGRLSATLIRIAPIHMPPPPLPSTTNSINQ